LPDAAIKVYARGLGEGVGAVGTTIADNLEGFGDEINAWTGTREGNNDSHPSTILRQCDNDMSGCRI